MADSVIKVTLLGDAKDLERAFKKTGDDARSWGDKMTSAGKSLSVGLTAPIVAGAALAVDAAADEAREMDKLADAIRRSVPGATDEMIAKNEEWATSLQNTIGVADSEIRAMEQKFISAGASIEDAQAKTAAAFDTATATGKDYNSIADAMVKGMNGQVSGFSRLGVAVKKADGTTKSFDEILQDLAKHQGAAADGAANAGGRADIMRLKMADLGEKLGTVLLPVMEKVVEIASKVADWFNNLSPAGSKVVVVIAGIAAAIGPLLIVGAKLVKAFGVIMKAFQVLKLAFMANPWGLLIAAVIALVALIIANWDKIKRFLLAVWEGIKRAAGVVWDAIKKGIKAAIDFIVKLFMNWTLPGLIMKHWDKIKEGVAAVATFIRDKWNAVIDFFKGLPARVGRAVSGLFDGLRNAFKNAINWIIGKWNDFRIRIKLPSILGGGEINIETPNIPKFHGGGVFRAPAGQREGLAVLSDGERVIAPGAGRRSLETGETRVYDIRVNSLDPRTAARLVVEALQTYERQNGAIPVAVRG